MRLEILEDRAACSVGFEDAPSVGVTSLYLANGNVIVCAGVDGGPRVEMRDSQGISLWSRFVADPSSRGGVDSETIVMLADASRSPVVQVVESPPVVPVFGVDLDANRVDGSAGSLIVYRTDPETLSITPAGPAPIGVGLIFTFPPSSTGEEVQRAILPQFVWTEIGDPDVFVATGPSVSKARDLSRYIEVNADSLDAVEIAAEVILRLSAK